MCNHSSQAAIVKLCKKCENIVFRINAILFHQKRSNVSSMTVISICGGNFHDFRKEEITEFRESIF